LKDRLVEAAGSLAAVRVIGWMTAFLDTPAVDAPAAEAFWLAVTATALSPRRGEFATFASGGW
jgi:hypothetical protein